MRWRKGAVLVAIHVEISEQTKQQAELGRPFILK